MKENSSFSFIFERDSLVQRLQMILPMMPLESLRLNQRLKGISREFFHFSGVRGHQSIIVLGDVLVDTAGEFTNKHNSGSVGA